MNANCAFLFYAVGGDEAAGFQFLFPTASLSFEGVSAAAAEAGAGRVGVAAAWAGYERGQSCGGDGCGSSSYGRGGGLLRIDIYVDGIAPSLRYADAERCGDACGLDGIELADAADRKSVV